MVALPCAAVALLLGCPRPPVSLAAGDGADLRVSQLAVDGPLRARLAAPDDADLVLFYGAERQGVLEPCGCPSNPRGSVYRFEAYVRAERRRHGTPDLVLDAGAWLDDTIGIGGGLREDVALSDAFMVEALAAGGWDALNLTPQELAWIEASGVRPARAVSANLRWTDGDWPPTHLHFERGGLRIAVTGVTGDALTFTESSAFEVGDPLAALGALLPELAAEADLVVVLAYALGDAARDVFALPGLDVLVEAGGFRERYPPYVQGATMWVRAEWEARRIGELRLRVADGRVVGAVDRHVDLDAAIPAGRASGRVARRARHAIAVARERLAAQ